MHDQPSTPSRSFTAAIESRATVDGALSKGSLTTADYAIMLARDDRPRLMMQTVEAMIECPVRRI